VSDIFVSYSSADRERVKPLVDTLLKKDWSIWWDRTIRPGETWDQVIEAAYGRVNLNVRERYLLTGPGGERHF